jgi:hypothetical protein
MEELRSATRRISQFNQWLKVDSNRIYIEYKSRELLLNLGVRIFDLKFSYFCEILIFRGR